MQDPHQLLAIYGQLEQENLFLIQASQEAEEGFEAAQAQLSSVQACALTGRYVVHEP